MKCWPKLALLETRVSNKIVEITSLRTKARLVYNLLVGWPTLYSLHEIEQDRFAPAFLPARWKCGSMLELLETRRHRLVLVCYARLALAPDAVVLADAPPSAFLAPAPSPIVLADAPPSALLA